MPRYPYLPIYPRQIEIDKVTKEIANRNHQNAALAASILKLTKAVAAGTAFVKQSQAAEKKAAADLKVAAGNPKVAAAVKVTLAKLQKQVAAAEKILAADAHQLQADTKSQGANVVFLKQLNAQLVISQGLLVAERLKYDAAMQAQIKLRQNFIAAAPGFTAQAHKIATPPAPAVIGWQKAAAAASKQLQALVMQALAPIRNPPGGIGLNGADMLAELVPLTNACFKANKAILAALGPFL